MKTKREKALPFKKSTYLFTIVGGAVLLNPAFAAGEKGAGGDDLEEIVITGIKASLKASMETKRDAVGVVDAINAEDIGKFPDTNLSEALQRVTGISIDRRDGEGAFVTARGFGPQYNMITLNGRNIPGADAFGGGDTITGGNGSGSRSFNFANLAAESISAVEVYKTGRADITTGGIGATINIKTARPLDNAGLVFNIGAKLLHDTSRNIEGNSVTPEVSGIFSFATPNKMFGIGVNASYQRRDSGTAESTVNDWHIQPWQAGSGNAGAAPLANNLQINGTGVNAIIDNAPNVGQLYGIPNDIRYAFSDIQTKRLNAQGVIQFAPIENLVITVDDTYASKEITQDRGEQTEWMQRNGFTHIVFDTDQAVATPVVLDELTGAGKDYGYEQARRMQKNTLNTFGVNVDFKLDRFSIAADYSDSTAKSLPNDPITGGGETLFSLAGKVPSTGNCVTSSCTGFWRSTFFFNNNLPKAERTLYPTNVDALAGTNGDSNYTFNGSTLGTQVLRLNYQSQVSKIKQFKLDASFEFADKDKFQFGVETRNMSMHQQNSGGYMPMGDWGVGDVGMPKIASLMNLLRPFSLTGAIKDYDTQGIPTMGWTGNADTLGLWAVSPSGGGYGNWAESTAPDGQLRYNPGFSNDNLVEEKTKAAYGQVSLQWDMGGVNTQLVAGGRYEKTDVTSTTIQLVPTGLLWQDDNDFQVIRPNTTTPFVGTGSYHFFLPNLGVDFHLTKQVTARLAYSKTIARSDFGNLFAGATVATPGGSTLNGFQANGNSTNPALLPYASNNFDASLEWYFSDTGYVSVGFFQKIVNNFIGTAVVNQNLFGIRDQTGGPEAQKVFAYLQSHNFATDDSSLFTAIAMDLNPGTFTDANGTWTGGLANFTGSNAQHIAFATQYDTVASNVASFGTATSTSAGSGNDPLYNFAVAQPVNNHSAKLHGFELGGQYFFGDTGVGVLANYTIVRSNTHFANDGDPNINQFALLGLSDSANGVLMYEKYGINARLAYNWRASFLQNANQGGFRNPVYVAAHKQWDMSVGYDFNKHFSMSVDGINLTGEDNRWYGRSVKQLWRLEDNSPRYSLGGRYKF